VAHVLVTGGTGFVGSACILKLLEEGHSVRTTVRNLAREPDVRAMIRQGGIEAGDRLAFVASDLGADPGWAEAVDGCDYVLHVASPIPPRSPKHEDDIIRPAREGTLRVLRAARDAGVKRVVLTSSFGAVGYGHPPRAEAFDETTWSDPAADVSAYIRSKILAERDAWDFVDREGGGLELCAINPTGIFGPVLGPDFSPSVQLIQRMLEGKMPGCPDVYFGIVDVRDLADLHVRAMTDPAAKGERFIATGGDHFPSILEMANVLRSRLGEQARKVPTRALPNWLVRLFALVNADAKETLFMLGYKRNATSAKAKGLLGWSPRSQEDALVASAESLIRLGLVKVG
jgi:nucleoside-diphosphate-sugar epimerase